MVTPVRYASGVDAGVGGRTVYLYLVLVVVLAVALPSTFLSLPA